MLFPCAAANSPTTPISTASGSAAAGPSESPLPAGEVGSECNELPGEGLCAPKLVQDRLKDPVEVPFDLGVRHTHDVETEVLERLCPVLVASPLVVGGMRSAVDFDDQLRIETDEIDDKSVDWMLAAKLPARQLTIAKLAPKIRLRRGFIEAARGSET